MSKQAKKRKVSAATSALACQQFEDEALTSFREAQIAYIQQRMNQEPSVINKIIGLLQTPETSPTNIKEYFPSCVRRFGKLKEETG